MTITMKLILSAQQVATAKLTMSAQNVKEVTTNGI